MTRWNLQGGKYESFCAVEKRENFDIAGMLFELVCESLAETIHTNANAQRSFRSDVLFTIGSLRVTSIIMVSKRRVRECP